MLCRQSNAVMARRKAEDIGESERAPSPLLSESRAKVALVR